MAELFLNIVNRSISASWVVLAVLLFRFVFQRGPKWVNVLLWGIVAVRLMCPFSFESILSLIPSAETVSPDIMMTKAPTIQTGISAVNRVVNPVISQTFAPAPGDSANPLQIWIPVCSVIWLIGMAILLLYAAVSCLRLVRKLDTAVLKKDNMFQSESVSTPFVLGVIRPRIYLPFQMDEQDQAYIVAHEQAHIRRKDHWWKPLGFLLLTVYWFNPLMWLAYVLLCRDIELACDEKVIKDLDREHRADYSQALLSQSVGRRRITACPLAFGEVGVKKRVSSVLHYQKPAFWMMTLSVGVCTTAAVCFLTNPIHKNEVLHLGLNAEIVDIDTEHHILYVKDIDEDAGVFGNECAIDCGRAIERYNMIYVNYYAEDDVRTIMFSDLWVGDDIIISLYDSEKLCAFNGSAAAEQVQLSTQRL